MIDKGCLWCCVRLYYAKVQIGTPPKEYYVQIDTGSDVLWISCMPCYGCPQSSGLNVSSSLAFFFWSFRREF